MTRGDPFELLAVRIAAVEFVEASRWISRPSDDGSARERVVHEGARWGAIQQAGSALSLQTYNHDPNVYRQTPRSSRLKVTDGKFVQVHSKNFESFTKTWKLEHTSATVDLADAQ